MHFDFKRLKDSTCDDREFETHLIRRFLDDVPDKLSRIDAAIAGDDASALRKTAHELKGACRSLGAVTLGDCAEKLEKTDPASKAEAWPELIVDCKAAFETVRNLLDQRVRDYHGGGNG